jgi:hypothetical protein
VCEFCDRNIYKPQSDTYGMPEMEPEWLHGDEPVETSGEKVVDSL